MPERFLNLSAEDRASILAKASQELGRHPIVLEKDVWVCFALEQLFSMPNAPKMAFKGGTSLSKIYNAIERFSEDIDVTINREDIAPDLDPFDPGLTKTRRKNVSRRIDEILAKYIADIIKPHFERYIAECFGNGAINVEIGDKPLKLNLQYESVIEESSDYMGDKVILEFGGTNKISPSELKQVTPYIKEIAKDLNYPTAAVTVLSPCRTFWEKATLIHVECNRPSPRPNLQRRSRHWYDLAKLADHQIGRDAVADRELLANVVEQKKILHHYHYADYDGCLSGSLRLIPDGEAVSKLRIDYQEMIDAKMFWREPPKFSEIMDRLKGLENEVNES